MDLKTGQHPLAKGVMLALSLLPAALPFQGRAEDAKDKSKDSSFSYSFNDISSNLVMITCKMPTGEAAGSGFLGRMDGKTYIFTNQHVIMGAGRIDFITAKGESLKPISVELAASRDIVRLELPDRTDALYISANVGMGSPIAVFGNSEGGATELYGKIEGVGADRLEVTAEFVSGNSGSPLLNENREVVGIASYVRISRHNRTTENTRFENKDRRFCYRLNDVQWVPVNWRKYNADYGLAYRENTELVEFLFDIINGMYEEPFSTVPENCSNAELKRWCGDHNRVVSHRSNQFRRELGSSAEALSSFCQRRARSMDIILKHRNLSGFLRNEFEGFESAYSYASEAIDYFGTKLPGVGY